MHSKKVKIVYKLSKKQLKPVFNWYNSNVSNRNLIALLVNDIPIGILTYDISDTIIGVIHFIQIKPEFQGKGYGRKLLDDFISLMKSKKIILIELFSANTKEATRFWENNHFIPIKIRNTNKKYYYKILIDSYLPNYNIKSNERIEIYKTSNLKKKTKPDIIFNIEREVNSSKLKYPIVCPVNIKWIMKWKKNEQIMFDNIIKFFDYKKVIYISNYDYLIITEL